MMKRKVLSLLVMVCLCLGMLPLGAVAEENAEAAYRQVGGNQYVIGIALDPYADALIINEGGQCMGQGVHGDPLPENPRALYKDIKVCVAVRKETSTDGVIYEEDKTNAVTIAVESMRLEHLEGAEDTFSWAEEGETVLEKTEGFEEGTSAPLYFKQGYEGTYMVRVQVAITANGTTETETVSMKVFTQNYDPKEYLRPEDDTVESLNQFLEETFGPDGNGETPAKVILKNGTYSGEIQLPENMKDAYIFVTEGQKGTVVEGGINLNNNVIYNIIGVDFIGDKGTGEGGKGSRAIYNGNCAVVAECTFQNYDVALDSQDALVNTQRNIFINNGIAARVDIEDAGPLGINDWTGNVFLGNDLAVQVISLHKDRSPYYFRITESNFIGNATDFEVECSGTLYFHKNYFGEKAKNAPSDSTEFLTRLDGAKTKGDLKELVTSQPPEVECDHGTTKVVTNPRWKEPLQYQLSQHLPTAAESEATVERTFASPVSGKEDDNASIENYLTVDWSLVTEIINDDASGLPISAAAFEGEEDKQIQVVDLQGNFMGTWQFPTEVDGATGSFLAGLQMASSQEDQLTVEIPGGDAIQTLQPTLTIDCQIPNAQVTVNGRKVASQQKGGQLTFSVPQSGTYVVQEETISPVVPDDDDGTLPPAPVVDGAEKGKVTFSPARPSQGQTVIVTATPDQGYRVDTVTVTDANGKTVTVTNRGSNQYAFIQPTGKVTIQVTFVWDNPFVDVGNEWYADAIEYVNVHNLMAGMSGTTFEPNTKLNRAMAAQILYNLEGKPAVTASSTFTDAAAAGEWALDAIAWAQQTGVVAGVGDNLFAPDAQVTREQFAQMMYNYAKYKGYDLTADGDLTQFSDSSKLQSWAVTAMKWANGNGLINGFEDDTLQPAGTTIRGQAASILMNFDLNVVQK